MELGFFRSPPRPEEYVVYPRNPTRFAIQSHCPPSGSSIQPPRAKRRPTRGIIGKGKVAGFPLTSDLRWPKRPSRQRLTGAVISRSKMSGKYPPSQSRLPEIKGRVVVVVAGMEGALASVVGGYALHWSLPYRPASDTGPHLAV